MRGTLDCRAGASEDWARRGAAACVVAGSARRNRGASTVELAIVFPVLMAIFFGILEWSFVLYDKAIVNNAAREGARAGVALRWKDDGTGHMTTDRWDAAQIRRKVTDHCRGKLIAIHGSVMCTATVSGAVSNPNFGDPLRVTASYTYSGTALLALYTLMFDPIVLTQTVVMTYE